MKFTHALKYNSVPEWRESYVNYSLLKKLILNASKEEANEGYGSAANHDEEAGPRSPLLSGQPSLTRSQPSLTRSQSVHLTLDQREKEFLETLDNELAKLIRFYLKKDAEISAECEELSIIVRHAEGIPSPRPEQAAGGCLVPAFGCCWAWLAAPARFCVSLQTAEAVCSKAT